MTAVVFYFQVHQPYRLRRYPAREIGLSRRYFDTRENRRIVRRVAERCYVPMNRMLLDAIERTEGRFRCAYSLSGTVIQQLEDWAPKALDSFVQLAETGSVEFLCETSHHSLAFLNDFDEWSAQIEDQRARIGRLFGRPPTTFRNTELILDGEIARRVEELGFEALLGEGTELLLGERSPNRTYRPEGCDRLRLLLRDYKLSDDIAFRFSNEEWSAFPLKADTYAQWLHELPEQVEFVGLFMDYETFGEHQWEHTGIFEFMHHLPEYVLEHSRFTFRTPAEVAAASVDPPELAIPRHFSWADEQRDLSAWMANPMQRAAHDALYLLARKVKRAAREGHPGLLDAWRKLSTSDHVYYMATAHLTDAEVHEYFSPWRTPHDAFVNYMNVLDDLEQRVDAALAQAAKQRRRAGRGAES